MNWKISHYPSFLLVTAIEPASLVHMCENILLRLTFLENELTSLMLRVWKRGRGKGAFIITMKMHPVESNFNYFENRGNFVQNKKEHLRSSLSFQEINRFCKCNLKKKKTPLQNLFFIFKRLE